MLTPTIPFKCGLVFPPRLDELTKLLLAELELERCEPASKQFVTQPDAIGIDDIGLAVVGDLLDFAVAEITPHLPPSMLSGFPSSPMILLISFSVVFACS